MPTPLVCDHIVFRALLKRGWIDVVTNTVLPGAFFRRPSPKDPDGLSVDTYSPQNCVAGFSTTFGVASLHVGRVRDLGLDVVPDEETHANVIGLPYAADDAAKAEFLASQLAKQARIVTNAR
jgi:hypothetical protein